MENLTGWRILTAIDEIKPGFSAKARAVNWKSDYAPEFLMLEMMAQTGAMIIGSANDFNGNVVFAKVESAVFSLPDAENELTVEAHARDGVGEQGSWIEAKISAGGAEAAAAKLFLIDAGDLDGSKISVTFHPEFLEYYRVREKIKKA